MRLDDLFREQHARRQVFGDLACHVVALDGDDLGILVGVLLLDFLVVALDQRQDLVVGGVGLALEVLQVAVDDVLAGDLEAVERHDLVLDHVLDFLDGDGMARGLALVLHVECRESDLALGQATCLRDLRVCRLDGVDDLVQIEACLRPVAFDDLH